MNEPHDIPVSNLQIPWEIIMEVSDVGYLHLGWIRYDIILMNVSSSERCFFYHNSSGGRPSLIVSDKLLKTA